MNHDSCRMKKVATEAAVRAGKPGSFAIEEVTEGGHSYKRLWLHLPDGTVGGFNLEPTPPHVPYPWPWNGSTSKPTLRRPVRLRGRWCGEIRAGRMISDPAPEAAAALTGLPPPPTPEPDRAAARQARGERS